MPRCDLEFRVVPIDSSGFLQIKIDAPNHCESVEFRTDITISALNSLVSDVADFLEDLAKQPADPRTRKGAALLADVRNAGGMVVTHLLGYDNKAQDLVSKVWAKKSSPIWIRTLGPIAASIPWELLVVDDGDHPDPPGMVGDRAIVYRVIEPKKEHEEQANRHGPTSARALSHHRLQYAQVEVASLERMLGGEPDFKHLPPITTPDIGAGVADICKFLDFEGRYYNILHLACHNAQSKNPYLAFEIEVRDGFRFNRGNLNGARRPSFCLPPQSLAFLNCCYSGSDLATPATLAHYLLVRGSSAVIAAPCRLFGKFAAAFSTAFYSRYLDPIRGDSELHTRCVGAALHYARRHLWNTEKSLCGYVYGLYGDPDVTGAQPVKEETRHAAE